MEPIYPRGPVSPSRDRRDPPQAPIDGLTVHEYVEICRALVRDGGDSARRIEEVLTGHGLTAERWAQLHAAWTVRIRSDPDVRSEFQRLYVGPHSGPGTGNE